MYTSYLYLINMIASSNTVIHDVKKLGHTWNM